MYYIMQRYTGMKPEKLKEYLRRHVISPNINGWKKLFGSSEAKYRRIFENAAEGIFQTSIDGRILAANPACVRILGYDSAEELIASVTDVRKLYAEPGRRLHLVRSIKG